MATNDDLPTCLDHIELGEGLIGKATAAYDNARQLDLSAITLGRPFDFERRNYLTAEAAMLAQLATAHFAAAQCLAIEVALAHDDTRPIDLTPVDSPYMGAPDDQEGGPDHG
jgi:hypothetical protein